MAENVIFETLEIDGFVYVPSYGAFMHSVAPSPFELIEGQEYKIVWDNIEYTRIAFAFTNPADNTSCIAVGNKMVATGENDGDLFAIVNDTTNNYTHLFSLENKTSHSVGIYQVVEEPKEDVVIVLKDHRGNDTEYEVPSGKVMFNTPDGGTRIFSDGDTISDVPIELDFSDGDQTIYAPEGYLVKSAIIKKPDTLVSKNIVKGVDIAGVVGTSEGSGGDVDAGEVEVLSARLDGFEPYGTSGTRYSITIPEFAELSIYTEYYVEWDGEIYICESSPNETGSGSARLGNSFHASANDTDTGEPFLVRNNSHQGTTTVYTQDVDVAHTIRIYYPSSNGKWIYTYNDAGEITRIKGVGVKAIPNEFIKGLSYLTSVDLSECPELTTIGTSFCYGCGKLLEVVLPASVSSIGGSMFSSCGYLRSIKFLGTYEQWISMDKGGSMLPNSYTVVYINGEPLPRDSIVIPDGITHIGNYAFSHSTYAGVVTIPDSVTSIGMYAFNYCQSITSVVIPDSVTSIGQYAFTRCSKLTNVDIGNNVTSIGDSAFSYCSAIKSVIIPDSVTTLGGSVLMYCTALTSVTFGSGITSMGSGVLNYSTNVSSITFKEGMTVIGNNMCNYGTSPAKHTFTSIVIPASVKKIGSYAFSNASNLTSATFTDPSGWYVSTSSSATSGTNVTLTNTSTAAKYLRSDYKTYYWFNGD